MSKIFPLKRLVESMIDGVVVAACGEVLSKMIDVFRDKDMLKRGEAHELFEEVRGEYENARIALSEIFYHLDDCDEYLNLVSKAFTELSKFTMGLEQYVLFVSDGRPGWRMCDWIIWLIKQRKSEYRMMIAISRSFMDNLFINSEFINKDDMLVFVKYLHIISENMTDEELDAI